MTWLSSGGVADDGESPGRGLCFIVSSEDALLSTQPLLPPRRPGHHQFSHAPGLPSATGQSSSLFPDVISSLFPSHPAPVLEGFLSFVFGYKGVGQSSPRGWTGLSGWEARVSAGLLREEVGLADSMRSHLSRVIGIRQNSRPDNTQIPIIR